MSSVMKYSHTIGLIVLDKAIWGVAVIAWQFYTNGKESAWYMFKSMGFIESEIVMARLRTLQYMQRKAESGNILIF